MILKMATPLLICHSENPYGGDLHGKKDESVPAENSELDISAGSGFQDIFG